MKIMCIGNELICIACIHTECALTAIHFECAFSQSTSISGLVPVWRQIASSCEIMQVLHSYVIDCMKKQVIRDETTSVTLLLCLGKLLYLWYHVWQGFLRAVSLHIRRCNLVWNHDLLSHINNWKEATVQLDSIITS